MYLRHVNLTKILVDIVIGFLFSFFLIRGFGLAHYRYVVRKRGGSYVEALKSVDKRSDTLDSRNKRKKKLLASLLEIR
jgi:hypothetical protein